MTPPVPGAPTDAAARNGTVRVVVVDDDALVRTGLRLLLGGDPTIEVVGEAGDGQEGLALVRQLVPHVALMDIRMPRLDGLAATRRVVEEGLPTRVLVLTTFDTDDMVLTALRHGAAGFLLKDTPPAALVEAVRRVAAGDPMLSPTVTARVIAAATGTRGDDVRRRQAVRRLDTLTAREREVASAVARGLTNAEIAADLHLGTATVKTHVGHLFEKLGATNRVQIARHVHDAGEA